MADLNENHVHSGVRTTPPSSRRHRGRDAAMLAGGAVLLGLGIAGGMLLSRQSDAPLDMPPPAAGVTATDPSTGEPLSQQDALAGSGAQMDAERTSGQRRATLTPKRERERADDQGAVASRRDSAYEDAGPARTEARAICGHCGVVESVTPVAVQGQSTGVGAVAGGVVGGLIGNQVGKGSGNTAATVLGAIGGGVAGNEIEKQRRTDTVYRVKVRMDDGSTRTFSRKSQVAPGTRVEVQGGEMKLVNSEG